MIQELFCTRGEMDIMPVFGTVVGGSNPSGCTKNRKLKAELWATMFLTPGGIRKAQARRRRAGAARFSSKKILVAESWVHKSFTCNMLHVKQRGYSLVVERILAKDKMGVRFSLLALEKDNA